MRGLTTPVVKTSPPQRLSVQPQKNPPKQKPPRAVSPEAACVPDHSRGQHMLPQQLPVQPKRIPQTKNRAVGSSSRACGTTCVSDQKPPRAVSPEAACVPDHSRGQHMLPQQLPVQPQKNPPNQKPPLWRHACLPRACERIPLSKEKNNIVIPEFSAWLTFVLERCRAENIRNLPRQRAPTPLFPERRPREACSMPISGCHDLPLATFNLPSRVFRHGCRRAECLERRWGGFFHTHSRGQRPLRQHPPGRRRNSPP